MSNMKSAQKMYISKWDDELYKGVIHKIIIELNSDSVTTKTTYYDHMGKYKQNQHLLDIADYENITQNDELQQFFIPIWNNLITTVIGRIYQILIDTDTNEITQFVKIYNNKTKYKMAIENLEQRNYTQIGQYHQDR